jgi:hypothetical protein
MSAACRLVEAGETDEGAPFDGGLGPAAEGLRLALRRVVDAKLPAGASFAEREVAYLAAANEAVRGNLREDLQQVARGHGERVRIGGVEYKRHETGIRVYHSLCGPMSVARATYRRVGEHNGPTVVPLDLETGIIEHGTPALVFAIASGCAEVTDRKCEEQLRADHREPPSRSTIQRIVKAVGDKAMMTATQIEAVIREKEELPAEAHALSVGLDRTSVPMEEPRPEGAPLPQNRRKRTKPYVRKVPERVDVNYRMAYVGTVSTVDPDGQALVVRRYAVSAEMGPDDVLRRMAADVRRVAEQRPGIDVGIVQDGAPEMWNLVRGALASIDITPSHQIVDRYHFNERIGAVLRIVEPDDEKRARERRKWAEAFDARDTAVVEYANWLESAIEQPRRRYSAKEREVLEDNRTFITNNGDRLRYASILAAGLPQGSGATEGSCRSVVSVRAKRSAQRWHVEGLDAILTLRAVKMSDRFPLFWQELAKKYTADVRNAA